ncbi:MAG: hypothetical protein WAO71_10250 [Gallionella sp.]
MGKTVGVARQQVAGLAKKSNQRKGTPSLPPLRDGCSGDVSGIEGFVGAIDVV